MKIIHKGINLTDYIVNSEDLKKDFKPTKEQLIEIALLNLLRYSQKLLIAIRDKEADQTELAKVGLHCLSENEKKIEKLLTN